MPYVSHNYRCQQRSKLSNAKEAILFVGFSGIAIFCTLMILGWLSSGNSNSTIVISESAKQAVSR
jgi:hypothetical protein